MSILVSNIRIGLDEADEAAFSIAMQRLKIKAADIKRISVHKKSIDARRIGNGKASFVVSVAVDLYKSESETVQAVSDAFVTYKENQPMKITKGKQKLNSPIAIIGLGPAGLFAAYLLAQEGYCPIVYERGADISSRVKAVEDFWENGVLDETTNVQFGEGGAGTFSDGKLTTRISDNRCSYILETLHKHGAPDSILKQAKPHIGTDKLRDVILSIRQAIEKSGGQVNFLSRLEDISYSSGKLKSIKVNGSEIEAEALVLAIGHSARDTFSMLYGKGIAMESKAFSVGVRIEQLQSTIDEGLYGEYAGHPNLPLGEYQLSHRCKDRCVYTFCMCPGGYVVPSSSCEGGVVTNGMSEHERNGKNANSALVVSVDSNDFGSAPLDGMKFQEALEKKAFEAGGGGYKAPAATVGGFIKSRYGLNIKSVAPTYARGVSEGDFAELFPKEIQSMLQLGLQVFDKKLKGFSNPDGILTGVETRTSSPVRILRNESGCSVSVDGLYPCGEGAGYAGGIMSAAVDGLRVAEAIMSRYASDTMSFHL